MTACVCGRTDCDEFNRKFHQMLVKNPDLLPPGMGIGSSPNYRFWRHKNKDYCYTTQRADEDKFWAMVYRWTGKKGQREVRLVKQVGFRQRKKAKQRAYDWYRKAQGLTLEAV